MMHFSIGHSKDGKIVDATVKLTKKGATIVTSTENLSDDEVHDLIKALQWAQKNKPNPKDGNEVVQPEDEQDELKPIGQLFLEKFFHQDRARELQIALVKAYKELGYTNVKIAKLLHIHESSVRRMLKK